MKEHDALPSRPSDAHINPKDKTSLSLEEGHALVLLARAGSTRARDRLVASCEGLVHKWAQRYAGVVPHLLDDLVAECRLAVFISIEKYDTTRLMKFSSYALFLIRNACSDLVRTQRWAVNAPVIRGRRSAAPGLSVESLIKPDDDGEDVETQLVAELGFESDVFFREKITAALKGLSPRDRDVIISRFFKDEVFEDVGVRWGVTRELARQRETKVLHKLRAAIDPTASFAPVLSANAVEKSTSRRAG